MGPTELDFWRKVKYSVYGTLVFILITSPLTYQFTNRMFQGLFTILDHGQPTPLGFLVHTVLFFFTTLAVMMFPRT